MTHSTDAAAIVGGLFATALVINTLFLATTRLVVSWVRVAPTKAALGWGPCLFRWPYGGGTLEIRLLAFFNAHVQFAGSNPYAEDPAPEPPLVLWPQASVWRRVVALFLPTRLAMLAVAAALLGPGRAWTAFSSGIGEVFAAFYGAGPLLDRAAEILAREGFGTLFAVTVAKCVAFQVLQVPSDLLMLTGAPHEKRAAQARVALVVVNLVVTLAWAIAFVRWIV